MLIGRFKKVCYVGKQVYKVKKLKVKKVMLLRCYAVMKFNKNGLLFTEHF